MFTKTRSLTLHAAALGLLLSTSASAQWTAIDLHPAGAFYSEANSIENGQIVGRVRFVSVD